jgi:hypothetical protein
LPRTLERIQRIGLTPGPIEREHELSPETLPERMLDDETLELGQHLRVPAKRLVGLDPLLERREWKFVQAGGLILSEGSMSEVAERRTPEETECLPEELCCSLVVPGPQGLLPLFEEKLEPFGIEFALLDTQRVAGSSGVEARTVSFLPEGASQA